MKKLAIISALALSGFAFNSASAQVHVSVGFNLGGPVVVQRPVAVYDDYYYLPEVDAYYSVGENLYYYNNGYEWVAAVYLPGAYRNYSWRNVRRVQIHANRPYLNHSVYRTRYRGNQFDWRRYDNRNDNRDWDRNAGNNRSGQNRGNDNRPDWNGNDNRNDNRGGRPDQRNDNRGSDNRGNSVFNRPAPSQPGRGEGRPSQNDNRGNSGFDRPAQPGRGEGRPSNDNRGRGNDNRPNFASNDGGGRRGTRS